MILFGFVFILYFINCGKWFLVWSKIVGVSCEFCEIFKNTFQQNTSGWLFLKKAKRVFKICFTTKKTWDHQLKKGTSDGFILTLCKWMSQRFIMSKTYPLINTIMQFLIHQVERNCHKNNVAIRKIMWQSGLAKPALDSLVKGSRKKSPKKSPTGP